MKQLIAGYGFVGKEVNKLFPDAEIYDLGYNVPNKTYDFAHVCVPTPQNKDGSCDTSAVKDVFGKIKADVFIVRSTVPIGFLSRYPNSVMQPEYVASSSPYPAPLSDPRKHSFIILGGKKETVKKVRRLYESIYPPTTQFIEMTSLEAEICKLMENSFIATYVTFCNEFYDICQKYGADYDKVREGFLADPRMTPWWTYVYPEKRGFSNSHCLPKDVNGIISCCRENGLELEFLKEVLKSNERFGKKM